MHSFEKFWGPQTGDSWFYIGLTGTRGHFLGKSEKNLEFFDGLFSTRNIPVHRGGDLLREIPDFGRTKTARREIFGFSKDFSRENPRFLPEKPQIFARFFSRFFPDFGPLWFLERYPIRFGSARKTRIFWPKNPRIFRKNPRIFRKNLEKIWQIFPLFSGKILARRLWFFLRKPGALP